ncbi:preprotein translocase subunit SecA [Marinobacterium lutimaris]|uniref:Protein translocase subunit SecA n=1 Tax=Marinobacterium lutimaris TaxID=568106 RepID=A0A1H6AH99_9GAMM|nr:DEAD/DEAH box helicase [Marinobacterium lutimaris]SEG48149.1 protein translocase subunit secA [Marinobacterium lutimaris]
MTAKVSQPALLPEVRLSYSAERDDRADDWEDRLSLAVASVPVRVWSQTYSRRARSALARINRLEPRLQSLDANGLAVEVENTRMNLRRDGIRSRAIYPAFALIRELCRRHLGMRHHDVQLLGGLAMLHGRLAEMDTGEGKTLTAALAAASAALAGIPVHVVTVNDYLAERDAQSLEPLYTALGLRVAVIKGGMERPERRQAYATEIVYCSNKELVFDYLRDRVTLAGKPSDMRRRVRNLLGAESPESGLVMRGLHFAIVDEADSVLVDEAKTPLIISRQSDVEAEKAWAGEALRLAAELEQPLHYRLRASERRIELTRQGRDYLEEAARDLGGIWESRIRREESVRQALSAQLLFKRGDHYLVLEGKVQIVDEYTGRIQPDRSWSDGLHQLIEVKEEVEVTPRNEVMARITYQRFFRRYLTLSGMSGTAREVRKELWNVYRLPVVRIPPNSPSLMRRLPARVVDSAEQKWTQVAERADQERLAGRPVLIGTRSVAASQTVSERLTDLGLEHAVLNAENDAEEAQIIARAGEPGCITVATNMAGRGVDISLPEEVVERGGLHVILTERHDSARIDRQLEGRCARRGQPGSCEAILSMEDALLEMFNESFSLSLTRLSASDSMRLKLLRKAQKRAEASHARTRRDLLRQDQKLVNLLAFAGGLE